jgi:hypothetical protein
MKTRWLPVGGWQQVDDDGRLVTLRTEDGITLSRVDDLVGTAEAAAMAGVKKPNFVRDIASRSDFPKPIGVLVSGRIWRKTEVEAFLGRMHRASSAEEIGSIAKRVMWWQPADRTLKRPLRFVAQVMAIGSFDEIERVRARYGERAFGRALTEAPAGVFDPRSWHYWHLVLGRAPVPPLPIRRFQ